MRANRSLPSYIQLFIFCISLGRWDLVSATDIGRELCEKASLKLLVTKSECAMIHNYNSEVVSFAVRISNMKIIKEDRQQEDYMSIRIIPNRSTPVELIGVRWSEPASVDNGRKKYEVRDITIYEFTAKDGGTVYVRKGLNTWQGDRIYKGNIEVNFQFEKNRNDFELLDDRLTDLFQHMELRREQEQP
jgi:hypothetical protein